MTSHDLQTIEVARKLRLYETILSSTSDLVYVLDLNLRFAYANTALLAAWGLSWSDAAGKSWLELGYSKEDADTLEHEIRQAIESKIAVKCIGAFGSKSNRMFEYAFVPVLGTSQEVEAIVGTARDVTETHQAKRELQDAAQRREEFITLLAHELRNPLAPILNGLHILQLGASDQATLNAVVGMMERQMSQMVRLVNDLIDVSRITRNALKIERTHLLLSDIVATAVEAARPLISKKGHSLSVLLPPEPIALNADRTRLTQVLVNLLSNSAKYMSAGGEIRLRVEGHPDSVTIAVADDGIGITEDELPRVFEMFARSARAMDTDRDGLGVGLSLTKSLVEMHGGKIRAESGGTGKGCQFVVTLPRLHLDRQTITQLDAPLQLQRGVSAAARRILVIDDNDDIAASMAIMLKALGHEVRTASNGLEGLNIASRYRPNVVFMDIGMPGLDGLKATERLRQEPWGRDVLVVALTGWGQESDRFKTKLAGFDHHLIKPVGLDELARLLREGRDNLH